MLRSFSNIALVLFFVALYVYVAAEVMFSGGYVSLRAWDVLVPALGATIGLRVLEWLCTPRGQMARQRQQMLRAVRSRR